MMLSRTGALYGKNSISRSNKSHLPELYQYGLGQYHAPQSVHLETDPEDILLHKPVSITAFSLCLCFSQGQRPSRRTQN